MSLGTRGMEKDDQNIKQKMLEMLFEKTGKYLPPKVMAFGIRPRLYGVISHPEGQARVSSDCGDTIEMYLRLKDGRVEEARFTSEGCVTTVAAGQAAAEMALGKTVRECLGINQSSISDYLDGLPEANRHCAYLAALALQRALRDYALHRRGVWRTDALKKSCGEDQE